ncbi:MAG: hypothetical protein KDC35_01035 [Acidobacteria bacterium]|nr:hypothetical protein [Acidobacteriota bacterium]
MILLFMLMVGSLKVVLCNGDEVEVAREPVYEGGYVTFDSDEWGHVRCPESWVVSVTPVSREKPVENPLKTTAEKSLPVAWVAQQKTTIIEVTNTTLKHYATTHATSNTSQILAPTQSQPRSESAEQVLHKAAEVQAEFAKRRDKMDREIAQVEAEIRALNRKSFLERDMFKKEEINQRRRKAEDKLGVLRDQRLQLLREGRMARGQALSETS